MKKIWRLCVLVLLVVVVSGSRAVVVADTTEEKLNWVFVPWVLSKPSKPELPKRCVKVSEDISCCGENTTVNSRQCTGSYYEEVEEKVYRKYDCTCFFLETWCSLPGCRRSSWQNWENPLANGIFAFSVYEREKISVIPESDAVFRSPSECEAWCRSQIIIPTPTPTPVCATCVRESRWGSVGQCDSNCEAYCPPGYHACEDSAHGGRCVVPDMVCYSQYWDGTRGRITGACCCPD